MKKYKYWMIASVVCYMLLAIMFAHQWYNDKQQHDRGYRVEVNRVQSQLTSLNHVATLDLSVYDYVTGIEALSIQDCGERQLTSFFSSQSDQQTTWFPWFKEHELEGYVKIYYQTGDAQGMNLLVLGELALLGLEIIILVVGFVLYRNLIKPFQQLVALPQQLAQGHYHGEIKVEKEGYIRNYLWGMSQLKDALEVSKKRQLQLMKEKKQLLLSLSHDIKTPLHMIGLYAKALEEHLYEEEAKQQWSYHQIIEKVNEIDAYVNSIRQSAQEDVVDLQVKKEDFYLSDLLERIIRVYQQTCKLRQINLQVAPYADCLLSGDLDRAQEVVENLLENALKYGDGRIVSLRFEEEESCQLIHVENTGTSVSEHEFNHLFDSFFRGANSTGQQGSGLGLYIAAQLMRKMDGAIYASMKKTGMCFTLVFH